VGIGLLALTCASGQVDDFRFMSIDLVNVGWQRHQLLQRCACRERTAVS
jgi:hypothetical protein